MLCFIAILLIEVTSNVETVQRFDKPELDDHTLAASSHVFPYMVAILQSSVYVSSGALIDENWILTAADGLYQTRETIKSTRVRLGSINYKKGGILLPVKLIKIHPYYDNTRPIFDIAMIMLPEPLRFTPKIKSIRLQKTLKNVAATHFIITSWNPLVNQKPKHQESMEAIQRRRILTVTHLHPSEPEVCSAELDLYNINRTDATMCLDPGAGSQKCVKNKNVGAPVVLNGILWGIVTSWTTADCDVDAAGVSFVTRTATNDIISWIHATMHGHRWKQRINE